MFPALPDRDERTRSTATAWESLAPGYVLQRYRDAGNVTVNLYILNAVRLPYLRTSVTVGVASSVANDVTVRMTS